MPGKTMGSSGAVCESGQPTLNEAAVPASAVGMEAGHAKSPTTASKLAASDISRRDFAIGYP